MPLPEMPELPPIPQPAIDPARWKPEDHASYTPSELRSYGLSCYRLGVERERERAAIEWVGSDGTQHEVTYSYAQDILRWAFDKYGDVAQLDAMIRKGE